MKSLFFLLILFIITGCSTDNAVYWCGDHPCINKKEKKAYFKKTMIVEKRNLEKNVYKNDSAIKKITELARLEEKRRIQEEKNLTKQAKLEEKRRIEEKKNLTKQAKLEEKRRIQEEKNLTKEAKLEEKRRIQEEKNLTKQIRLEEKERLKAEKKSSRKKQPQKIVKSDTEVADAEIKFSKFSELVEQITKKNILRPYPDINDIPN